MPRERHYFTAEPIWQGETCFIICGGSSVRDANLSVLAGHKVMVINSSIAVYPAADVLIFGDSRWWQHYKHRLQAIKDFAGLIVTRSQSIAEERVKNMRQLKPQEIGGLTPDRRALAMNWTTMTAALNLALHFGVKRIGLIGADMQRGDRGETHHHAPHPWPIVEGCWETQMGELRLAVPALAAAGIETVNLSPRSLIDWWPRMSLSEFVNG